MLSAKNGGITGELLVLTMHGISNKKDLLDDFYSRHDDELPGEADIESDFTTALNMMWSIYDSDNRSLFKTKSNFYSLFGSLLRYFREEHRRAFTSPDAVKVSLVEFLSAVREQQFDNEKPEIEEYQEAVSRAASDRGRRARREDILFNVVRAAEAN